MESVGVSFQMNLTVAALDAVFVRVVLFQTGDKQLPDTAVADLVHRALISVPLVEITDNAYTCGFRRPYSENYAFLSVLFRKMRTEEIVSFRNVTFMEKVQGKLVLLGHFISHFALLLSYQTAKAVYYAADRCCK